MLDTLLRKYNERKAIKAWNKSTLGQALALQAREYFYGEIRSLSGMSEKAKQKIIGDFYSKVFAIDQAANPFLQLRENIASYVIEFAKLQVLCLTPEEKADQFYSDCPYISGELRPHIRQLSDHNEELKQLKWSHENLTDEELIAFCNSRSAVLLYYVNGMNMVRVDRGDNGDPKDWFKPFFRSMLIYEEDLCRGQINLPPLLPNSLDALRHSVFMNEVVNGAANPLYTWETKLQEAFEESSASGPTSSLQA